MKDKPFIYYTHSGNFHADEVMGAAICLLTNRCKSTCRVKSLEEIPQSNKKVDSLIADIGRRYDPENLLFDHHQGVIRRDNGIMYASAGLLWKHFGMEVIKKNIQGISDDIIPDIYNFVDKNLIQGLDSHDADSSYEVKAIASGSFVKVTTLSEIIKSYNVLEGGDDMFLNSALLCKSILLNEIIVIYNRLIDSIEVHKVLQKVENYDNIAIIDKGLRWKSVVINEYPELSFVITKSVHPGSNYALIAVPTSENSRNIKLPIERPEWFKNFIHQGKWIAGSDDIEELVKLAKFSTDINFVSV